MWPCAFVYVVAKNQCSRCHLTDGHAAGHGSFLIVSMEVSEMAEDFLCSYILKHSFHVKVGVHHVSSFSFPKPRAGQRQKTSQEETVYSSFHQDFIVIVNIF